jgi:hypothetical protein
MSDPWWERLPGRLLEEEAALLALHGGEVPLVRSHRWTREADGEPRVRVELDLASREVELEVRFPAHYPEGCPSVRPVPYELLSTHQFVRSGVLCLELGPDNWHPHYTAADMVSSAWRLVVQEIISTFEPIDIPSRHVPDLAERIRMGDGVLVRPLGLDACIENAKTSCSFEYVLGSHGGVRVFPVGFPKGSPLPDVPPSLARETPLTGYFVPLKEGAPTSIPTEPEAFDEYLTEHADATAAHEPPVVFLVRVPNGRTQGVVRFKESVAELVDMTIEDGSTARTPSGLGDELSKQKIAVVGLGSLGSRIALSLARTGARRFVLVDGDVLEAPNLCRFPASYAHVGATKVSLVKEFLRDVCPTEPDVETHAVHVAAATNPVLHARVLENLAAADILIDATASPDAFSLLAMVASDHRKPLLWGEVFGGGLGGLVASAHPDRGPCPRCVRAGLLATIQSWPPAPGRRVGTPYAAGERDDGEPLVATDADVAAIAAAMTQRVLDMVRGELSTASAVLLGFRRSWVFDAPPQSIAVPVRADDWSCARCWQAAAEPDENIAAQAEALFAAKHDAHDPAAG